VVDTTPVSLRGIAVCADGGGRREGSLSLIGKVYQGVVCVESDMESDSMELTPLPQLEPSAKPWVDRVVRSPAVRSGYLSLAAHLLLCTLMALLALNEKQQPQIRPLVLSIRSQTEDDRVGESQDAMEIGAADEAGGDNAAIPHAEAAADGDDPSPVAMAEPELEPPTDDEPPTDATTVDVGTSDPAVASPLGDTPIAPPTSSRPVAPRSTSARVQAAARAVGVRGGPPDGRPFAARRGTARNAAVRGRGGNAASEAAVERGLEWLALHQAVDGSWQFDLSSCHCNGACRDPGTLSSSTASTAIALLPFLGAGHTHVEGRHQQTVSRGIYYLLSRMQQTPRGGDFCEGTMYGHGVTTLVLAEALGMTKDDLLVQPVRDAVRFIETAQDMHSGGWRYLPGQAGDITVTAWQLTALKSAQLAGLEAPSPTIDGVRRFLDRVQDPKQKGAAYGYRTPVAKPCTSAIGLLCRIYTGWGPEQEALQRGLANLTKRGPVTPPSTRTSTSHRPWCSLSTLAGHSGIGRTATRSSPNRPALATSRGAGFSLTATPPQVAGSRTRPSPS